MRATGSKIKRKEAFLAWQMLLLMVVLLLFGAQRASAAPEAEVTIDLCAKMGSVTMPDSTVIDIWGFALKPADVPCTDESVVAQLPGPQLEVNVGDNVTLNLHNALNENVSILFPGQNMIPDVVGAAPNETVSYAFTVSNPGTYLYESGTNAATQVPMGLYGPLIVRSATPNQAYDDAASAYNVETLLVLSEIDPALNADPANFNMLDYAPTYWLINGKAFPDTDTMTVEPGQRVLLRYLNAGAINHTMTLLGSYQYVIAKDAYPLNFPFEVVAETIPSGQTVDMIVTIPSSAVNQDKFMLYNRQLNVTNVDSFPGGMMTVLQVQTDPTAVSMSSFGASKEISGRSLALAFVGCVLLFMALSFAYRSRERI